MAPRFLITGCGRSGTTYLARVLTGLGVTCGHEQVFNPWNIESGDAWWGDEQLGESSWLAAPFLAELPAELALFHQVRRPLQVVRSFARMRFFEPCEEYRSYFDFAVAAAPRLQAGSELERCFRYWLDWNLLVESEADAAGRSLERYTLEGLDARRLCTIARAAGIEVTVRQAEQALAASDPSTNTRGDKRADDEITWQSLRDEGLKREVLDLAERYGYDALELELVPNDSTDRIRA